MLKQICVDAWNALTRRKMRSFLTMAGIVWGIVAVTLLIAYGSGFRAVLVHGFNAFGKSAVARGSRPAGIARARPRVPGCTAIPQGRGTARFLNTPASNGCGCRSTS